MHIEFYGESHCGKVRPANEDAFFIEGGQHFYAVADGLGGLPGGAQTSQRTLELIGKALSHPNAQATAPDWGQLVREVNQTVTKEGFAAHPFTGSGSTLTAAHVVGDQLTVVHVGDSAAYLLREGQLRKLTEDHTMEQDWIAEHGTDSLDLMPPEMGHTLTRCIGQNSDLPVDQAVHTLEPGDCLLLCTDGLSKVLPEATILKTLQQNASPKSACQALIDLANESGGHDNITGIVLRVR
jgi:protein phosphatase